MTKKNFILSFALFVLGIAALTAWRYSQEILNLKEQGFVMWEFAHTPMNEKRQRQFKVSPGKEWTLEASGEVVVQAVRVYASNGAVLFDSDICTFCDPWLSEKAKSEFDVFWDKELETQKATRLRHLSEQEQALKEYEASN